jgi:hypothetical protein
VELPIGDRRGGRPVAVKISKVASGLRRLGDDGACDGQTSTMEASSAARGTLSHPALALAFDS